MKLILTIILTLFINVLCIPLWTECDYVGFIRTLFNKEARLDLLYSGTITRAEPFQYKVTPTPFYATWIYGSGNNIHRSNLCLRARGKWQELSLQLKVRRDGKITILLRGPSVHDEYGFPNCVLVDWRNLKINGETILSKRGAFSWGKGFAKQLSVKKGDVLQIEGEFRRHHFSTHDFTRLKSGKVWYIITGNLLLFSLIYLLLSYLAKRRESIRLSDMMLLIVFFLLLFIPMIHISNDLKSRREHRMLTTKPELKEIFEKNFNYGKRYENWFNDHFCGRVALMKIHDIIRNKLSSVIRTKRAIYFKDNGWEFRWPPMIPTVELERKSAFPQSIVRSIVRLNQFCQQHHIKLYVLEVPHKELIYREIIKKNLGYDKNQVTKVLQALQTIRDGVRKCHIPYIYPHSALRDAATQDYVFFKWSHHWTGWGAYVGYRELMKAVSKDFPDVPTVTLEDYRRSQSWLLRDDYNEFYGRAWQFDLYFNNGEMDDPPNRTLYNYYDNKNGGRMTYKVGKFTKDFTYPGGGKRKILLIGSSQNENFLQFLPYSAAQTKYIRVNQGQVKTDDEYKILRLYKKDILSFKPDILILSISTDNLPRLCDICATK